MAAEKLSVDLPSDVMQLVRRHVESGAYVSNSEVVQEALRHWDARDKRLEQVRARLDEAADDPENLTPDEVRRHFDRLTIEAETHRA